MTRSETLGVGASILSSVLAGTAAVATRFVIGGIGPVELALFRYASGATLLLLLVLALGSSRVAPNDRVPIIVLGILYFALFPVLFNLSLAHTTAAHGAIALATAPVLTMLLAALMRTEELTWPKGLGVCLATAGVVCALGGTLGSVARSEWIGDTLMVATALCSSLYCVLSRSYVIRYPALQFTAYAMLAGAVTLGIGTAGLASGGLGAFPALGRLSLPGWMAVAYLSLICTPFVFVLWTYGLRHSTPTRVAVTGAVNPITAVMLAPVLLAEEITASLVAGLLLVVLGIACTTWNPRPSPLVSLRSASKVTATR